MNFGSASSNHEDRARAVTQAIAQAEAELIANPTFGPADRYALQAVELSLLPEGKARAKYVGRFYSHSRVDLHTGEPADRDTAIKAWALGTNSLGFWYMTKHDRVWNAAENYRKRAHENPVHRHHWAMISIAAAAAQEIRALDDLAVEAFVTSTTGRVDVDSELAGLATQILGAAEVREKIGGEPTGDTPEIRHAHALWKRHTDELELHVTQPVLKRIEALFEYRDRLRALQIQTATVYRIKQSRGIDDQLDALVLNSGSDIDGLARIDSASTELHQAEIARTAALAQVRGDYLNALLSP